ncbi:MAG: class B sortase [Clostridium sp.]
MNKIKVIISVVAGILLVFALYKILDKLCEYERANKSYNELGQVYNIEGKETEINTYRDKYNSLKNINNEYKFWIKIENTEIDYPVTQSENNDYYIKYDFDNVESISGCIFVDYRNDIKNDNNLILYGHNMRNKTMFNNLGKFKDKNFFYENNKIIITDEEGEKIYEVFSVYIIDYREDFGDPNYLLKDKYIKYIEEIKSKSMYQSNANVNADDNVITLVTCSYEFDNARVVVHGKLIKF